MNPFAEAYTQFTACATPILIAMFGALLLGVLAGWTLRPARNEVPAEITAVNLELGAKLKVAEDKATATTTEMTRMRVRHSEEKERLERTLGAVQAEVQSMKEALVAAQRKTTLLSSHTGVARLSTTTQDQVRITELQKEAARIPALLREIETLKTGAVKSEPAKTSRAKKSSPHANGELPDQVYKLLSSSFGRKISRDDLELVEGIGPKIREHLQKNGFKTWSDVAAAKPAELKKVLAKAGERYQMHDPASWPEQARLMQENRWEELMKYQRKLSRTR